MIYIKIEVVLGTPIEDAVDEACALANQINECVKFSFNGVDLMANPHDDPSRLRKFFWGKRGRRDINKFGEKTK